MEFGWSQEEEAFRAELRAVIAETLPEGWRTRVPGDEPYSDVTLAFCRKLAAKGWFAPHWPTAYGGAGDASPWRFAILTEELWANGEPRGSQYMNVNWIGPALIAAGDEAQKRRFLPRIAAGEMLWCQGFSEPEAGSDLAALRTRAVRDGDGYVLDGEKIWTSYAAGAHYCFLLARTGEETGAAGGISIFLVPMDAPGVTVKVAPTMLGIHQVHHLTFENVRLSMDDRLGAENAGWAVIREALADERVGTPRHMRAAVVLEAVVAQAERQGRLGEADLASIAEARAACVAARLMAYRFRQLRSGGGVEGEANVARAAIVRAERAVAEVAGNLGGPEGLVSGSLHDGEFRTALIAGLGGGAYEIQLNLIARLWLHLPKAA
ncbi:MAG: acyl-CoA dehydrogenase [Phenylobacterium sp.]|nr:acyl-CoA dehydrogenase [Phenylobacterium sp.]